MIEFEVPKPIAQQSYVLKTVAENMMRPLSRKFDENEHDVPWDYINFMHMAMRATGAGSLAPSNGEPKMDPMVSQDHALAINCWLSCWKYYPGVM
jgi:hypothetical protein